MSDILYVQGSASTHSWVFRGPRVLVDPAAADAAWVRTLRTGLQRLMADLKRDAQAAYADVPPIRDGFTYDTQASPFVRGRLRNASPLFAVVEYRTRAHVITGRPWLVFMGNAGHLVKIHSVNHPGTAGRYAIDPLFDRADPQFLALMNAAAEAMLNA